MAQKSILNPKGLVEQLKGGSFEGFSVNLDEERADESFESFLQGGNIQRIDLSEYAGSLGGYMNDGKDYSGPVNQFLEGREVGVFAKGRKLFETKINSSSLDFRRTGKFSVKTPFTGNSDIKDVFPGISDKLPGNVQTIEDVARALDIQKLNFKPVSEVPGDPKNNAMNKSSKLGLGVIGVAAAAFIGYKVIS
jgi:hypothetical protein